MATKLNLTWVLAFTFICVHVIARIVQAGNISTSHNQTEIDESQDIKKSLQSEIPEGCDPDIPNLSVGDGIIKNFEELRKYKKNTKVYFLGISSSNCIKCCQGEVVLNQVHNTFINKEVGYKKKPIPIIRIDISTFDGDLLEEEGLDVKNVPMLAFHTNRVTYEYTETFHKSFILHFINRKLYPIVLLKTEDDVNSFINPAKEWIENTPFYLEEYSGFGELFPLFKRVTRVIAFIKDKVELKDELEQFKEAALQLADRDDLRVAKVTDKTLASKYKDMYGLDWFSEVSSNSIVMIKKDYNQPEPIIRVYDLNTQTELFKDWINQNSLEPLEEMSGFSFKIISQLRKPMFMAFVNKTHKEYEKESNQLLRILKEIAPDYPQYVFTFTEEERYKETKNELGITWDEEPSLALNHFLTKESTPFPKGKPFTKRNVVFYINSIIDRSILSPDFKLPDSRKEYLKHLKYVKKIKKNKFSEIAMDKEKDVAVLFLDSSHINKDSEKIIEAYGKAAKRYNELNIKSVRLAMFDVFKQSPPTGFDQKIDSYSTCRVFVLSSLNKYGPYHEVKKLTTQGIMTEIHEYADIPFDLPDFPHLDEIEMYQLESGTYHEDL
ncbi:unnamed protein product [Moneuplotes crassus]|uniref:Protein disulfide isomerase n=1 Tax=Euplotes crassus TaxID=5936 RepID=A0AAD1X954_EUPCR|nr:unnamed protein product [Moneuplotes crassus]